MLPENLFKDLFKRLRPLYGITVDKLWIEYQVADVDRKREIEEALLRVAVKHLGIGLGDERIILEPPTASAVSDGVYRLGDVSYPGLDPYPCRVRRNDLLRHVFLLGPTGTGKSTFILGLLQQLLADGRPFMVFDFKRNYRCLLADDGGSEQSWVLVLTVGRDVAPLALNAMTPPSGVPFGEWAEALADVISSSYLLMQGARNVLKESLLQARDAFGEDATFRRAYDLLVAELEKAKSGSRRYGWLESSVRSLDELSKGGFGLALNAITGTTVQALLDLPVVFELQGLGDDQKQFFCLYVLQSILGIRKNSQAQREVLQHVLVFDESHNVFPKDQYGELGVASRLAREVREYGEAIIAATQQSDVSDSLIANTGYKIILRTDYPKDVMFASRLMQLEERWFPKLPVGQAIIRLPNRYYSPFLITFPEQPLKNTSVTDERVRNQWRSSPVGAFTLAGPAIEQALGETTPPSLAAAPSVEIVVSEQEHTLLLDVVAHPIAFITDRYQRLAWSSRTGNQVKDSLITKGLARFEPVPTPTAQVKIFRFTTVGERYLTDHGVALSRSRHGGAAHEYWRQMLTERLTKRGFAVTAEAPVGDGKTVDLRAEKQQRVLWIEIETGRSDVSANLAKCHGLVGAVVFFFTTAAVATAHASAVTAAGAIALTPDRIGDLDALG
jgi:Helicase HerA, central domain